jgi:WD40 repeat protein
LEAADLDGDGRIEVVQSNEYYFIHIISSTGKALASHYVHKWAPRVFPLLLSDIDSDGKKEIICGASDGKVRVFKWDPGITQGAERTFAPILNEVWSITLGGEVTCLAVLSDGSESPLIAAGSHGYRLTCMDSSGSTVWDIDLGIAAEWIWPEKEGIYALGGGNIFLVSRDGRLLKTWEAGGEITAAVRTDGRFFIGTKEGRILCIKTACTAGTHLAKT